MTPVLIGAGIGIAYSSMLTAVVSLMLKPLASWPEVVRVWRVAVALGAIGGVVAGWLV